MIKYIIAFSITLTLLVSCNKDTSEKLDEDEFNVKIDIGDNNEIGYLGKGILPNQGINDPHIHIFNDKAYLFASHDDGEGNNEYLMKDWLLYSSKDLVHWDKEFVLKPENTFIGKPIAKCFATDGATRNGKYYFYFSNHNESTGVAVSDNPEGPYVDVLKKPILPKDLTFNNEYDPTIFIDDDGKHYIVWGYTGWGTYYQIAELNEDMQSLKTAPQNLKVTDDVLENDASYLHKHKGIYYLNTHHGKYATSNTLYGPYTYRGQLDASGDHGTFFTWHNQTYYAYGAWQSNYFRYTRLTYAHYKDNGEIVAEDKLGGSQTLGVGRYDASLEKIEAEWFFAASDSLEKRDNNDGFEIRNIQNNTFLFYPKVFKLPTNPIIEFNVKSTHKSGGIIEVRSDSTTGPLLGTCKVQSSTNSQNYVTIECNLNLKTASTNIYLVFKGDKGELMHLDWFKFKSKNN